MGPFPIVPTLCVDDPAVWFWEPQQETARLVLDVNKIVDQKLDLLVDLGRLQAMGYEGCLWHFGCL